MKNLLKVRVKLSEPYSLSFKDEGEYGLKTFIYILCYEHIDV